jgi:hypothetical protein
MLRSIPPDIDPAKLEPGHAIVASTANYLFGLRSGVLMNPL